MMVFITILILSLRIAQSNLVFMDGYYFPQIIYEHTLFLNQNISLVKSSTNRNLIQTLNNQNILVSFMGMSYNPNSSNIFSEINSFSNASITDFCSQLFYQYSFVINQLGQVAYMDVSSKNIAFSFQTNITGKSKIAVTNQTIYIINYFSQNQTRAILYRFSRLNFTLLETIATNITGTIQIRVCKKYQLLIEETIVLWNQTSFFTMFYCTENCSNIFQIHNNFAGDITQDILFSSCFSIIVEYDNIMPVTNYVFSNGATYSVALIGQKILAMKYWDQSGQHISFYLQSNVMKIYSLWGSLAYPYNLVIEYNVFSSLSYFSLLDLPLRKIYVPSSNRIDSYQIQCPNLTYMSVTNLCTSCQANCSSCDPHNGSCLSCQNQFILQQGSCYKINSTQIQQSQSIFINVMTYSITQISQVLQRLFLIFKTAPLSFLFLRFINYWNITSFYLLLGLQAPDYLTNCLKMIYNSINSSLFQQIGIEIQLNLNIPQKVNGSNFIKYGISSNFIQSNLQNFILTMFAFFGLFLVITIKKLCPLPSWIKKNLNINKFLVMIGQYVPLMSSFFFPISFIYQKMSYINCIDKLNISLYIIFGGISILIPFILVSYFQIIKKKQIKKNLKNQKIQQKKLIFEQYNWFFNSLVNITASFMISFRFVAAFFVINLFTFGFGIFTNLKSTKNRINNVILSCHIFLFNFAFLAMYFFENRSNIWYQKFSFLVIFFLFLGAIHQIITFFSQIMISSIIWIKSKINSKVSAIQSESQQKKQNFQMKQAIHIQQNPIQNILINKIQGEVQKETIKRQIIFPKKIKLKQFKQTKGYLKTKQMLLFKEHDSIQKKDQFQNASEGQI